MNDLLILIPGRVRVLHPLPPDGGGFYSLKRKSDGAILLDGDAHARFNSGEEAAAWARHHGAYEAVVVWVPKLNPIDA